MEELADTYEPIVRSYVQRCDAPTRALLEPAIQHILNGIERICPAAMLMTPNGLATAYGPSDEIASCRLPVLAATPRRYVILAADRWPQAIPPQVKCSNATLWASIATIIETGDAQFLATAVGWRLTKDMAAALRKQALTQRKRGYVPLLLVICAHEKRSDGTQVGCGFCVVMPLPPSINDQFCSQSVEPPRESLEINLGG
jgi:hypothetical protein